MSAQSVSGKVIDADGPVIGELIVVQLGWPELRMNPLAFEVGLTWKVGLMAIFVTVVAAAQVQKSCFQNDWLITLFLTGRNGPTGFIR